MSIELPVNHDDPGADQPRAAAATVRGGRGAQLGAARAARQPAGRAVRARTGGHVRDGARQHAEPGAGHVAGQVDRGEAVQVVAQRQRQQRRQPQQRHHLRRRAVAVGHRVASWGETICHGPASGPRGSVATCTAVGKGYGEALRSCHVSADRAAAAPPARARRRRARAAGRAPGAPRRAGARDAARMVLSCTGGRQACRRSLLPCL